MAKKTNAGSKKTTRPGGTIAEQRMKFGILHALHMLRTGNRGTLVSKIGLRGVRQG